MNHANDPAWYESLSDWTLNIQHKADVNLNKEFNFPTDAKKEEEKK